MAVLLGFVCFGNGQEVSAKVLNTVPKAMRGTWYDKYGGRSTFGAHSLTNIDHFNHKVSITHYHLATHSPAIKKWVNHKPQYDKVTKNERVNSYSNGRVVIWWQANGSKTGTMHPTYYQLSHKVVNGHKFQKLIEAIGAGFGISPSNYYRVKKLPKAHGFHYYQHPNMIRLTEGIWAKRLRITYPIASAKPDKTAYIPKGSRLIIQNPGTFYWTIVKNDKYPETSKHVWYVPKNESDTNWFVILHHYKTKKLL